MWDLDARSLSHELKFEVLQAVAYVDAAELESHFLRVILQLGWSLSPNRVVSLPVGVWEPFAQQCVL